MAKPLYSREKSPLYGLKSRKKLLKLLGIDTYSELENILDECDTYYKPFTLEIGEKKRNVNKTTGKVKNIHQNLSELIRRIVTPEYHTSKRKSSSRIHAEMHLGNGFLYTTDISNFFPNCIRKRIAFSLKKHFEMAGDIAFILSKLLTYKERIPQGGHASDIVCFWSNYSMFEEINNFCKKNGLLFSLYVDDIAISSREHIPYEYRYKILDILKKNGFEANKKKTKYFTDSQPKHIAGMVIVKERLRIANKKRQKLFFLLDQKENPHSIMGLYRYCKSVENDFLPSLEGVIKKRIQKNLLNPPPRSPSSSS